MNLKWIVLAVIVVVAVAAVWAMRKAGGSPLKRKAMFRPWYPEK